MTGAVLFYNCTLYVERLSQHAKLIIALYKVIMCTSNTTYFLIAILLVIVITIMQRVPYYCKFSRRCDISISIRKISECFSYDLDFFFIGSTPSFICLVASCSSNSARVVPAPITIVATKHIFSFSS
jgi:hypothetical protein